MKRALKKPSGEATALFAATVLLFVGCSDVPGRVHPPVYSANAGAEALFAYDSDGNGGIEGAEFDKVPALRAALGQIDADQDGSLTAAEIDARISAWRSTRIAEMPVRCEVTLDGEPLSDARISFEPEAFLGPRVQRADGETREGGSAGMSIAKELRSDPRYLGVACGWYKIRVTSEKRQIPARYNTESTLGCEVAMDAAWVNHGAVEIPMKSR